MANTVTQSAANLLILKFTGLPNPGGISVPGVLPGDAIVAGTVNGLPIWNQFQTLFEPVITVADTFQQLGKGMDGPDFTLYLLRAGA